MSNLVLVSAKKRRFNPYKAVEWSGYVLVAAIVIACMAYIVVNWNALNTPGLDLPWWSWPVGMIGTVGWIAVILGAGWLFIVACVGVGAFYSWLRERGREYGKMED